MAVQTEITSRGLRGLSDAREALSRIEDFLHFCGLVSCIQRTLVTMRSLRYDARTYADQVVDILTRALSMRRAVLRVHYGLRQC